MKYASEAVTKSELFTPDIITMVAGDAAQRRSKLARVETLTIVV